MQRSWRCAVVMVALTVLGAGTDARARAQNPLVSALLEARDFRLRVQAAFAMGDSRDPAYRPPLERALRDADPAVRAAAATALGRLGDRRALPALAALVADSSAAVRLQVERSIATLEAVPASPAPGAEAAEPRVPWHRVRYVVIVGDVRDQSGDGLAPALLVQLGELLGRNVAQLRGVAVLAEEQLLDGDTRREIARRRLPVLRLEGELRALTRAEHEGNVRLRVEVTVMLLSRQGALRSLMSAAATGAEPDRGADREQDERLASQALVAAVQSAMSRVLRALRSAGGNQ